MSKKELQKQNYLLNTHLDSTFDIIRKLNLNNVNLFHRIDSLTIVSKSKDLRIDSMNKVISTVNQSLNVTLKSVVEKNHIINDYKDSIRDINNEITMMKSFFQWLLISENYSSRVEILKENIFLEAYSSPEWNKLRSLISWSNISSEFDDLVKKQQLGNVVIMSTVVRHFDSGIPNYAYGHHDYNIEKKLYFLKVNDTIKQISLADCFVNNKFLLKEINLIAKKQLDEDLKISELWSCGSKINLPLSYDNLELEINDKEICFLYSDNLSPGSPCDRPRTSVCFQKSYLSKYLK